MNELEKKFHRYYTINFESYTFINTNKIEETRQNNTDNYKL